MSRDLLINIIEKLEIKYSQQPDNYIALNESEYKNLAKGAKYLIEKCPESIDFTKYMEDSSIVEIANQTNIYKNREGLLHQLDLILEVEKSPISLSYRAIKDFLKFYLMLLKINPSLILDSEKYTELSGYIRVLRLEAN